MTYSEKLRHPLWQKKRLQILERDRWTCLTCGATDKPLNVYHLLHIKSNCPWEYSDNHYQTLCEDCRKEREEITDKALNAIRLSLGNVPTHKLSAIADKLYKLATE